MILKRYKVYYIKNKKNMCYDSKRKDKKYNMLTGGMFNSFSNVSKAS